MYEFDDRIGALLGQDRMESECDELEVYSLAQTIDEPDFVENRQCAKCVGECKVY